MDSDELVSVLEDAGLSPYQADAYVALLELGAAPATDVAEQSGVPDPRIYDVLRNLEEAGYVETYEQDALHARAHDPQEVLDDLETRADRFSAAAEEIERRWDQPPIEDSVVSIVQRFETVLNNAVEAIAAAENQVQVSASVDRFERLRPALRDAAENGAAVHLSIYTESGDEAALPDVDEVAEVCTEARHRHVPSPFVAIVDRTTTCFAPHAGSTNEYGVLVDDRTHTYVFHWFFLTTLWDAGDRYYSAADGDPPIEYVDVRYCIRDVAPLLEDGATVRIRIEGIDTDSGSERVVEGTVADVIATGPEPRGTASIADYGGQVGLIVDTEDGPVEVGGWGAMVEEVEAHALTVLSIE